MTLAVYPYSYFLKDIDAMTAKNSFNKGKSWQDKVLEADAIWEQVKAIFDAHQSALPETPRRPDVRMIVDNISGQEVRFNNPGDHSGSKEEIIPGAGDKRAVMVMIKGATLDEQNRNAKRLFDLYDLGACGLSAEFVNDMTSGKLSALVDEAYGPAPFAAQAEKLVDVAWKLEDGTETLLKPETGVAAAYGARAATMESVFLAQFHIYVKGTGTTAELAESHGMNIAVSKDWQPPYDERTRPIVPSVAKVYYGAYVDAIPCAIVHPDGMVKEVILSDGVVLAPKGASRKPPQQKP